MILTQRRTIRNKAKALGFDPDIAFRIEEELLRESALASTKSIQSKDRQGFTQREVQQLLHILRRQLWRKTREKACFKKEASENWIGANKEEEEGQSYFEEFSFYNGLAKKAKQREKTLVNLITKLKGMK